LSRRHVAIGLALALGPALALAQGAPESLLPPVFERQAGRTGQPQAPSAEATAPRIEPQPAVGNAQSPGQAGQQSAAGGKGLPSGLRIPTIAELETLSPDELGELLGLKPKADIPASRRRALRQVGLIASYEGGFPANAIASQDAGLIRAVLAGNNGMMVSRWGHILVRRALASRLDAPRGMNPADFAALRAALLARMGEVEAARAIVQDVDTGSYSPALVDAAVDAYVASADFTGLCPVFSIHGSLRQDAQWDALKAICAAFQGDGSAAFAKLDSMQAKSSLPKIDLLLAQKYAGAAGRTRRAVKIEWDGVNGMTPLRYGLTIAVGLEPPSPLLDADRRRYDLVAASAPMLGLAARVSAAERAAGVGVLSNAALVDLYGQILGMDEADNAWVDRAERLQAAYAGDDDQARIAAMRALWDDGATQAQQYARQVLTARAAARIKPDPALADVSARLIASMLSAGLDRNALLWVPVCQTGSEGWALLALAAPHRPNPVSEDALVSFIDDDSSDGARKSAFLVAGLAGLGRLAPEIVKEYDGKLELGLGRQTRWTRLIDRAAQVGDPALVALLAGLGMQGSGWNRMTPRHLFHIVSALHGVGLTAEARMIASEAVARG